MISEETLNKVLEHYRELRDNDEAFNLENAAFEYLKRNPFFWEVVLYFNNLFVRFRETPDDDNKESLQFTIDKLIFVMNRQFLYSGIDILNAYDIFSGQNSDISTALHTKAYQYKSERNRKGRYGYSDIYADGLVVIEPDASSNDFKKEHYVDMDRILQKNGVERWLEHLKPSVYIKINPFHSVKSLKSDLQALMAMITENEKDLADFASSEILMNELGKHESSFRTPTFNKIPSLKKLVLYDLHRIFQLEGKHIKQVLDDLFPGDEDSSYTQKLFSDNLLSEILAKEVNPVLKKINGEYLSLVYSDESIDTHFQLIEKSMEPTEINIPIDKIDSDMLEFASKLNKYRDTESSLDSLKGTEISTDINFFLQKNIRTTSNTDISRKTKNILDDVSADEISKILLL